MSKIEIHLRDEALTRLMVWIDGMDLPMFILRQEPRDRLQFVHANAALGRAADIPVSIFPGHVASEIFPPRIAARLEANYRQCMAASEPVSYEECLLIDGRDTWWQTTLSKPSGFDGKLILGVAIPTTEQKAREFATAEAMADLTRQFEDLQLFSTMAVHDARSPLATVASLIDIIGDGFQDMGDGKAELLRLCSKTVDEALTQITATLKRGQALEGTVSMSSRVDLGRLCSNIAAMVDPEMRLSIDIPRAVVECDEVVMQMSLRNLMSNAVRYCETRISVALSEANGRLIVDVADDGPGLPKGADIIELTRKGTERDGAHGFGLASIEKVLRSRGGCLGVMSEDRPLNGACFRIEMPGNVLSSADNIPAQDAERLAV